MPLLGQYEYIIDKTHPRANADGAVYVHYIVAEQILGRPLLAGEWVHHKDQNKTNNHPDNIMVFASNEDHSRFHAYHLDESLLSINENGVYTCAKLQKYCIDCKVPVSYWGLRCPKCAHLHNRKVTRPTKQQLKDMLLQVNGNFTQVARKYGVTDNAIRKWCKIYDIPYKSKDYKNNFQNLSQTS